MLQIWRNAAPKTTLVIVTLALAATLGGCANVNSIYREGRGDGDKIAFVDAKQRAITISKVIDKVDRRGDGVDQYISRYCAEPSPDAFSVFSAALSSGVSVPAQVSASVAAALTETGASIGLRTQTIQVLRDSMYRLCEAYNNGAISGNAVQRAHLQAQNVMLALVAVEQLTGYAKPTVTQIGGEASGSAEASQKLQVIQEIQDTLSDASKKEASLSEEVKKSNESTSNAEREYRDAVEAERNNKDTAASNRLKQQTDSAERKMNAERSTNSEKKAELSRTREYVRNLNDLTELATKASASSGSRFGTTTQPTGTGLSEGQVAATAQAVRDIVTASLISYDTIDRCLTTLEEARIGDSNGDTKASLMCEEYLSKALPAQQAFDADLRRYNAETERLRLNLQYQDASSGADTQASSSEDRDSSSDSGASPPQAAPSPNSPVQRRLEPLEILPPSPSSSQPKNRL